jgi:hypothetical protein
MLRNVKIASGATLWLAPALIFASAFSSLTAAKEQAWDPVIWERPPEGSLDAHR